VYGLNEDADVVAENLAECFIYLLHSPPLREAPPTFPFIRELV
jgi:hypothetical protein